MADQAHKFKLGLFIVSTILLAVIGLIWLGASRFFEDSRIAVAYFADSVQGLEADSPVKFRGVPVGRVKQIKMAPDGRLVEILMSLDKSFHLNEDLGIKMNLLGLTGMKYLEIDTIKPELKREQYTLDFTPKYPVIQTYPSDIREIGNALESIFQKVKGFDLERISANLVKITNKIDAAIGELRFAKLSAETSEAIKEVRDAAKRVNDEIAKAQISRNMNKTLDKASEFFQESTETTRSADRMIRRTDNNINRLTQKLDRSADNLIDFTRMIKQKPSSIIFGPDEKSQK